MLSNPRGFSEQQYARSIQETGFCNYREKIVRINHSNSPDWQMTGKCNRDIIRNRITLITFNFKLRNLKNAEKLEKGGGRGGEGGTEVTLQEYSKHEETGSETHESNRYIGQWYGQSIKKYIFVSAISTNTNVEYFHSCSRTNSIAIVSSPLNTNCERFRWKSILKSIEQLQTTSDRMKERERERERSNDRENRGNFFAVPIPWRGNVSKSRFTTDSEPSDGTGV